MSQEQSLNTVPRTTWTTIVSVSLPSDEVRWLKALGVSEGEKIMVLRQAIFGGPFHVRVGSGGEFAVDPQLATQIRVSL